MTNTFSVEPDGSVKKFHYDENTGVATLETVHDATPLIDHCKAQANAGWSDSGIKKGFWKVASLPLWVIAEMKTKGVDILGKHDSRSALKLIDRDYPWLKTTGKRIA